MVKNNGFPHDNVCVCVCVCEAPYVALRCWDRQEVAVYIFSLDRTPRFVYVSHIHDAILTCFRYDNSTVVLRALELHVVHGGGPVDGEDRRLARRGFGVGLRVSVAFPAHRLNGVDEDPHA